MSTEVVSPSYCKSVLNEGALMKLIGLIEITDSGKQICSEIYWYQGLIVCRGINHNTVGDLERTYEDAATALFQVGLYQQQWDKAKASRAAA